MNRNKIGKSILLLLTTASLLSSCGKSETAEGSKSEPAGKQTVAVVHPQYRDFVKEIEITGRAEPYRKVMIRAMESGYLKELYKDIGDRVNKGELIAELGNPELLRKKEELEAELQAKKSGYERLEAARKQSPGLIPQQEADEARAAYLSAEAALAAVNDRIEFLKIKAPFDGIVTARYLDQGAMLQSALQNGDAPVIYRIESLQPIRLVLDVPEVDAVYVKAGMEARVQFPALGERMLKARVSRTAGSIDKESATLRVEVDIPNNDRRISLGIFARVRLQLHSRSQVISLPVTAGIMKDGKTAIMRVKDGRIEWLEVTRGLSSRDYFEVLDPPLDEESLIVVDGKNLVDPGQEVEAILKK